MSIDNDKVMLLFIILYRMKYMKNPTHGQMAVLVLKLVIWFRFHFDIFDLVFWMMRLRFRMVAYVLSRFFWWRKVSDLGQPGSYMWFGFGR